MLAGKRLVVTGVITRDSIAYAVAEHAQRAGAEVVLTGFGRARRLTERAARRLPEPPDVIEVRSRAIDGQVAIEVDDEGSGVPPELQGEIFKRFARADASRNGAEGGLGLGLAIVDAIAKAHGGHCTFRASPAGSVSDMR